VPGPGAACSRPCRDSCRDPTAGSVRPQAKCSRAGQPGLVRLADGAALPAPEQDFVARLLAAAPKLADAIAVAQRLNRLLRRDSDEGLGRVLTNTASHRALRI
jgi:hypothetical protein